MTSMRLATLNIRERLDRETVIWAVAPSIVAIMITALFVVPNYARALRMQDEAQRLEAVSSENITQKNNLQLLERNVASLRDEANRRCRPLAEGTDRDRLLSTITRPTDGTVVREQSIRTGALVQVDGVAIGSPVLRREVTVDMSASFESIFGVLDSAEGVNQLVTPRSVEIVVMNTPLEQSASGNAVVRATIVFEEWFEQQPAQGAASKEAHQ
jgi:hypothetical protein